MALDYHNTSRGTGYSINSDGTVTRHTNSIAGQRSTSNKQHNSGRWWWLFFVVIVIIAVSIGIYVYYETSYLNVSKSYISVGAEGETISILVRSNRDWSISTRPASWGHARIYGNTIEWEIEPNTNTISRTDYIDLSCTNRTVRINIEQEALKYLTISPTDIDASAMGEEFSFTISTNESWHISTNTYSWGHLVKHGDALSLTIDENPKTEDRDDYFVITSKSGIECRVDIHQAGSFLFTDKDNLVFDYYGTSQTIQVLCGSDWEIDENTEPWAHLSRSGDILTLSCDYNSGEKRYDWFVLKSGSLRWRVDFIQN